MSKFTERCLRRYFGYQYIKWAYPFTYIHRSVLRKPHGHRKHYKVPNSEFLCRIYFSRYILKSFLYAKHCGKAK